MGEGWLFWNREMPYFCVGESVKSEFAVVRAHSALAHSSKWQLLYAVGKGNQFDDEYDTNIDSVKEVYKQMYISFWHFC